MRICVPDSDTSSSSSALSFYSLVDLPEFPTISPTMANYEQVNSDSEMIDTSVRDLLIGLPQNELQELLRIREERIAGRPLTQSDPPAPPKPNLSPPNPTYTLVPRRETSLPK